MRVSKEQSIKDKAEVARVKEAVTAAGYNVGSCKRIRYADGDILDVHIIVLDSTTGHERNEINSKVKPLARAALTSERIRTIYVNCYDESFWCRGTQKRKAK